MVGSETDLWLVRILFFSVGLLLGHAVVAAQFLAFHHITAVSMGRATSLFNVQNRIGQALGVVLLAGLLGAFGTDALEATGVEQPLLVAYRFAAAFLLAALFFGLRIQKADV